MNERIMYERLVEAAIEKFDFEKALILCNTVGGYSSNTSVNAMKQIVRDMFNRTIDHLINTGGPSLLSSTSGFECYLSNLNHPEETMAGICGIKFVPVESEVCAEELEEENVTEEKINETLNTRLDKIDKRLEHILKKIEKNDQEINHLFAMNEN